MSNTVTELRSSPRIRSFLRGEIIHSGGASRTQCTIRDISEAGARIQVPVSVTLPECFELVIQAKGRTEQAKIVWLSGNEIGVSFASVQTQAVPLTDLKLEIMSRIGALELAISQMQFEINNLRHSVFKISKEKEQAEVA